MTSLLTSACRRRLSFYHLPLLYSTTTYIPEETPSSVSTSTATTNEETQSTVSTVTDSLFCHESDPTRSISTLFSFPDQSCARYAADHALRSLSKSLNITSRSDLLDSFLHLASSEQDFASLLISYGSAFLPKKALSAFHRRLAATTTTSGSISVSTLSFNALLSAFIRSRRYKEVPDLFVLVCKEHCIRPDVVSYGLLVHALFLSNRSTDAFAALKQVREGQGIAPTDQIYRLLLVSLRSHEKSEEANQLLNDMVANGVRLDCTAYNVKVWYHAIRGETERVLKLISEMETSVVKRARPDTITYNYLMGCLCKNGRVEDVKEVYKKMMMSKTKRCSPNAVTFKHVLRCLCRSGDFEAGLEVFRDSLRNNNVRHFGAVRKLVEGLVKEGKVEAAKEVVKEVRNKFNISLTTHGKELEKELGLVSDCEVADLSQEAVKW